MANVLGKFSRDRSEATQELGAIREKLDTLWEDSVRALETAEKMAHRRTTNDYIMRANLGYDPTEQALEKALLALRDRKATIVQDIELWLDTSFDADTITSLRTKLFPPIHFAVIGGGALSSLRDFVQDLKHLCDETYDVDRRLAFFTDSSGAGPPSHANSAPSSIDTPPRRTSRLFVGYSHKSARWLKRLKTHFLPLQRSGIIDLWADTRITPGSIWRDEINAALSEAAAAVLLITADFLASDFVHSNELPTILKAQQDRGLLVIPVFADPCAVPNELLQFQGLNAPSRTLLEMTNAERERLFVRLVEFVMKRFEAV